MAHNRAHNRDHSIHFEECPKYVSEKKKHLEVNCNVWNIQLEIFKNKLFTVY